MNRALIVGIADYGRLKQPLPGCANDLVNWRDLFAARLGTGADGLRSLADSAATRSALIDRLRWLLSEIEDGDHRIFFFAGHGARVRRRDPATGLVRQEVDETLVAYPGDSDEHEDFMLFDDDLADILDGTSFNPSARLTLIFDSCHSGGMLRPLITGDDPDLDLPFPRCLNLAEEEREKARTLELDSFVERAPLSGDVTARDRDMAEPAPRRFGSLAFARSPTPRVIVAAARAEQSAWDDRMPDDERHGVFSYHAVAVLGAENGATFKGVIARVTPEIGRKFPQKPMLLGDASRFGSAPFSELASSSLCAHWGRPR